MFSRIEIPTSLDPLKGLYISAHGLYSSEVIQLRCRYGHWQEDGGNEESSNLEFYQYVETLKLTGDPYVPAGQAKFTRKFEELTQSASTQGITPPNELDVWCDVVGTKNGRIYGLGMECTVIRGWPYYHGTSSSNGWTQSQELEKLKKDLEGVKQERDELRIKIVNIERLFKENNAMIRQWMNSINRQSMPLSFE
ncbi:hypothetical protein DEO72_LG8g2286 [Vigna unguiculata]|uniref:Uncharacterized protein n=1 Tax=Vigna unguiculata TaxID=3917 RepID=A0A4D6MUI5_VIGUN|nr:hypothetical protein DEO72_LG8g2286 [Vigna unguiculata]